LNGILKKVVNEEKPVPKSLSDNLKPASTISLINLYPKPSSKYIILSVISNLRYE
jgi:hypothetical protein